MAAMLYTSVKKIRTYFVSITNRFVDFIYKIEYFEGKKSIAKILYFYYSVAGGMYHENYIRPGFKRCLIIFYAFSNIFIGVAVLSSLGFLQPVDFIALITCVAMFSSLLKVFVGILCTYNHREEFQNVFEKVNGFSDNFKSVEKESEDNDNYQLVDYKKFLRFFNFFFTVFAFATLFGKIIFFFLSKHGTSNAPIHIKLAQHYIYPFPFAKSPTTVEYTLIYLLQVITMLPIICSFFGLYIFSFLFLTYMRNQITSLRWEMNTKSNSTISFIEQCYDRELVISKKKGMIKKKELLDLFKKRQICCNEFFEDVKKWIERYHQIFSMMKLLQKFLNVVLSVQLACTIISSIISTFGLIWKMKANEGGFEEHVSLFAVPLCLLMLICKIGSLFNNLSNELVDEIYAMPWYYLSPKQRKVILNFLTMAQKSLAVLAFDVYPITLSLFPDIASKVYNYVQIMQNVEKKFQK